MMKKESPKITHNEILVYAISNVGDKWLDLQRRVVGIKDSDPTLAKELISRCPWKEKLELLFDLYKIETGSEFDGKEQYYINELESLTGQQMKLIIEIPEEVYEKQGYSQYFGAWSVVLQKCFENGTPFSKGL